MSQSPSPRQDRSRVLQACENCREKKSKCDGAKPTCGRCRLKSLECHYGVSRKVKNQQVMRHLAAKVAQYENILRKSIPSQHIIHHGEQGSAEQSFAASVLATSASSSTYSEIATSLSNVGSAGAQHMLPIPMSPQLSEHSSEASPPRYNAQSWADNLLNDTPLPPRPLLEQACSAFFQGSAILFTFFEEEEVVALFDDVYGHKIASGDRISLIQLCATAAVGCQYYPQRFDAATRTAFLSIVRLHIDDCIEKAPLSAMRVACLLSMYFTFEKRTVALIYVNMGLYLASMNKNKIMFWQEPSTPSQRVFGSLVFLESWLCATTGRLPSPQNRELYFSVALMGNGSSSINVVAQREMFKIAVMSTSILQNVYYARFVSSTIINSYKNQLQHWLLALPECMRLDNLVDAHEHRHSLRPVFLIHLLYMNTVILIYRRILAEFARLGLELSDARIFNRAQSFLQPCLWTGRQVAKILEIALSQDQILQKCWMIINATYTTCNVMLYFATNKLIQARSSDEVSYDIAAAKQCIEILAFCSKNDKAASEYLSTTTVLYEQISQIHESSIAGSQQETQQILAKRKKCLQQTLAATASLLIHPFDGGFRREARKVQEYFSNPSGERASRPLSKESDESDAEEFKFERVAGEGDVHFFLSDLLYNNIGLDRLNSKDKELVQDSDFVSPTSDFDAIFGS